MHTILPIIATILVTAFILFILIRMFRNLSNPAKPFIAEPQKLKANTESIVLDKLGCNISMFDEHGVSVLESREIKSIPPQAHFIDNSNSAINRVRYLAADLLKGVVNTPNKTIELVFKPEIQKGMADGVYKLMQTKNGEYLADAINLKKRIVGKGRVVEAGKARQLASGAFQLVSIAVAQSHLADIEKSLSAINASLSQVLDKLENEDISRITGASDYLREIAIHMKELRCPDELSPQKKNVIESIIKDYLSWRNKLDEEINSLTEQIKKLDDLDTFGTGNTFKRLESLIGQVQPLLKRRELLLNLASALNFVTAYLDPARDEYSKISVNETHWISLLDNFTSTVSQTASKYMKKALWNSSETLELRRYKLGSLSSNSREVAEKQQNNYLTLQSRLSENIAHFIDPNGNVRVAISFDEKGNVSKAAIL